MSLILTFLGTDGSDRTTLAIASAKKLVQAGSKVLLATGISNLSLTTSLGVTASPSLREIEPNLFLVGLSTTAILEQQWEYLKVLEKKYLQTPVLNSIYGQELPVLPGMDDALILAALREYDKSGLYDVIIYDGSGDLRMLRLLAMPEVLSGYVKRFRTVIAESDIGKLVIPLLQPLLGSIFSSSFNWETLSANSSSGPGEFLEEGKRAVNDPEKVRAYLVTRDEPNSMQVAKYLWGNAQLAGVTVAGAFLVQPTSTQPIIEEFTPLPLTQLPVLTDWSSIVDLIPDLSQSIKAPKPLEIDQVNRQIKVFLPGFDKKQVKLTQQGDTVTLEAGEQRRNIPLESTLKGRSVTGAKFLEGYLIISF